MKKLLLTLFLCLLTTNSFGAAPTRDNTYTTGSVISSADVTANEDAIFNYLQSGVDTYSDNTIVNADVNASANIQSDKLNLTSVAQGVLITSGGSFTNQGNSTFTGTTIADLGTVTTGVMTNIDINGGPIDGVVIGASSAATISNAEYLNGSIQGSVDIAGGNVQGDIWYDNGTATTRLTAGTDGQFLQTQGAGANPVWASQMGKLLSSTTATTQDNSGTITIAPSKQYLVTCDYRQGGGAGILSLRFNGASGASDYAYIYEKLTMATSPTETQVGDDAHTNIVLDADIDGDTFVKIKLYINTYQEDNSGSNRSAFVTGEVVSRNLGNVWTTTKLSGIYLADVTIASFIIEDLINVADSTAWRTNVYELSQ